MTLKTLKKDNSLRFISDRATDIIADEKKTNTIVHEEQSPNTIKTLKRNYLVKNLRLISALKGVTFLN